MNMMPFIVGAFVGVAIKSEGGRQLIDTVLTKANIEARKAFFPEEHEIEAERGLLHESTMCSDTHTPKTHAYSNAATKEA